MNLLISLEEAKQYLNIQNEEHDEKLAFLIQALSDAMEVYLGRYIISKEIIQEPRFTEVPSKELRLHFYPVQSVQEVELMDGTFLPVGAYITDGVRGVLYRDTAWPLKTLVTYTTGICTGTAEVPSDIKLALCLWMAELWSKDAYVKAETLGDYSVTYETAQGLSSQASMLLEKYRRQSL